MAVAIIAIIVAAVTAITAGTKATVDAKKSNRTEFTYIMLNSPVYKRGMDYEAAKAYHLELYKKDAQMFNQIYNEVTAKRFSEGLDGTADVEVDNKKTTRNALLVIALIMIILIFKEVI